MIARDHLFFLQPHPPSRALRCGQADQIGQLLVGQAAVVLQRAEYFEVESVNRYHAYFSCLMHKSCIKIANLNQFCMHIAGWMTENPSQIRCQGSSAMGPFPHDAPAATISADNPMGTDGFEFVEYAHPNPEELHVLFRLMGYVPVARHKTKQITVYRQGDINYLVNEEPGSHGLNFVAAHGPCAPSMAFRVVESDRGCLRALSLGAEPADASSAQKTLNVPAIKVIGGRSGG